MVQSASWQGHHVELLVVADGHGNEKHKYSDIGARLATTVVAAQLNRFLDEVKPTENIKSRENGFRRWLDLLHRKWVEEIIDYAERYRQQLRDEQSLPLQWDAQADKEALLTLFGSTVRFVIVEQHYFWFASIGDGATAVFSLPKSSSSQANATAKTATAIQSKIDFIDTDFNKMGPEVRSLAELNASYAWQWSSHPRKQGMAVMVMSDGVNDCFNKENLTAFCSSLITIPIKYGTAYLDRIMPEELKGKAEQSSRDDASLALWIDGILLRYRERQLLVNTDDPPKVSIKPDVIASTPAQAMQSDPKPVEQLSDQRVDCGKENRVPVAPAESNRVTNNDAEQQSVSRGIKT